MRYYQDKRGKWRWHVISKNKKIIACSSQGYKHKADCVKSVQLTREVLNGIA